MQLEIINPQGRVSYRRPEKHPDIAEALRTVGYSVRFKINPGESYAAVWQILNIDVPGNYVLAYNHHTGKATVWAKHYQPTLPEMERATDWGEIADPDPLPALVGLPPLETDPTAAPDPELERIAEAISRAAKSDPLIDECLAMLKVGIEGGDSPREVMRRCCANFALRAAGIEIPGQGTASLEAFAAEPLRGADEAVFPRPGAAAWFCDPVPYPARIVQQHDAFEWEIVLWPTKQGQTAGESENRLIAKTTQLEPFSEGEDREVARTGTLAHPHCRSDGDGHCTWKRCPQIRDGEPEKSGRHCPFCTRRRDDEEAC